jgi:hypothetical protein
LKQIGGGTKLKKVIIVGIILSLAFLFGCTSLGIRNNVNNGTGVNTGTDSSNSSNTSNTSNAASISQPLLIQEYFLMRENTRYIYEGKGNEYAAYDVIMDYIAEGRIQQRVNNGGTETARVIELKDGRLTKLLSRGEVYYRENLLKTPGGEEEILLMEPLAKGTTWTLKDSSVKTITGTSVEVSTPSGSYIAIEVTTDGPNGKTLDYYAKDIGLVKSVFNPGESEVTSSLSKIEENVQLVQRISFFYPNINDGKIYYKEKDLSFKTNDITKKVLETAYKETVDRDLGLAFSRNTIINSLYLNQDGMVYIDLNSAFLKEMNAGAGYERDILQSIADTFGKYYMAKRIILTIDNNLYESGHIAFKKGEYLEVRYEDTIEMK